MKKSILLLLAALFCACMVGCGDTATDKVDEFAENAQQAGLDWVITPSESVTNAMVNKWSVVGSDDVYKFRASGRGSLNGEDLTFECGFNEDNKITMSIEMGGKKTVYLLTTDTTGYGVEMQPAAGGDKICLIPADMEFLSLDDKRAPIVGEWKDANGNLYTFTKDFELNIDGVNNDSEGTFSVVAESDDTLILCLVINGSGYEYEYEVSEEGKTLKLNTPGDDTVHEWIKTE